jgi:hypothetical protein
MFISSDKEELQAYQDNSQCRAKSIGKSYLKQKKKFIENWT